MKKSIRLALAQVNCVVGDLSFNSGKIRDYMARAQVAGADIVSFPELAITGYPPEDLLFKAHFVLKNIETLKEIARATGDIIAIVGFADRKGAKVYNAAAILYKGKIRGIYHKMCLPNYGVFDEFRYFAMGDEPLVFRADNIIFAVNICEDIWRLKGPLTSQLKAGAQVLLNISASPYHIGKIRERQRVIQSKARKHKLLISYANLVGGQDELVFDGRSMIVGRNGSISGMARAFEEDLLICDMDIDIARQRGKAGMLTIEKTFGKKARKQACPSAQPCENAGEVYSALLLGLKDYVSKNGFKKVLIGLSGGIDSALVAALAADALGKDNVVGVFMPSRYSSQQSADDAKAVALNLGIRYDVVGIEHLFKLYLMTLDSLFAGQEKNIAEENLQARIRGNILMALSNKFGWLVLATGNKSEMSTGYATLYGDMVGGFAVIKDVPKTLVYKLARYRNSISRVIPESVIVRPPTAELKPDQKDTDTLPAYEKLDPVLKAYVEDDRDIKKMVSSGISEADAVKIITMVDRSEYKRRQSPIGIRITPRAFGRDRRMPITNRFKEY